MLLAVNAIMRSQAEATGSFRSYQSFSGIGLFAWHNSDALHSSMRRSGSNTRVHCTVLKTSTVLVRSRSGATVSVKRKPGERWERYSQALASSDTVRPVKTVATVVLLDVPIVVAAPSCCLLRTIISRRNFDAAHPTVDSIPN